MNLIHMETEAVESTLNRLRSAALEMDTQIQRLQSAQNRLGSAWKGGSSPTEFLRDMNTLIQKLTVSRLQLETLHQRLSTELTEWMDYAQLLWGGAANLLASGNTAAFSAPDILADIRKQVCGEVSNSENARCVSIWGNPPSNAEHLAYMVMSLPASLPILIMQLGNGEFLVMLRGTTEGLDEGSNLGSAVESMFGYSSYQNSVINALKEANLPKGAKLHFAGHSQGGMIAQNLAVDPRILLQYEVETVSMFGSPDTLAPANPFVRYTSFEAPGDLVSKLDDAVLAVFPQAAPLLKDVTFLADRHIIVDSAEAWNIDPNVSHSVYDNEGVLKDYKIPFQVETWQGVATADASISTPGPSIYKGLVKTKDAAGHVVRRLQELRVF